MTLSPQTLAELRAQVPGLQRQVHGQPLIYLDYAATSHRPQRVLDAVHDASTRLTANVHRGVHQVGAEVSQAYDSARVRVARFLNAPSGEVVFTAGTTDGLNLAAFCIGAGLTPGDRILVTVTEHHSNLVPWQLAAERTGARVEAIPLSREPGHEGELDLAAFHELLAGGRVKVVAFPLISNVLGTRAPVAELVAGAHDVGALAVIDAAQAAAHQPLDVKALGADALTFGAHKVFGPTGAGVLWARRELLAAWPPWRGGGGMITEVRIGHSEFRGGPERFEAGTPNLPGALGLAAALDWLEEIGWPAIEAREAELVAYGERVLAEVPGLKRLPGRPRIPLFAFSLAGVHPHDVGSLLDQEGIAVRSGRHCTDPLHAALDLTGSTRASLSFLSREAELDALAAGLQRAREVLGG